MKDHKFVVLERIVKSGVLNLGRNIWLAVAAIAMMTITLTIFLFAIVANATFAHTINDFNSRINVSVYLKDSVTSDQRDKFLSQLKQVDDVKNVTYKSKEQVLKDYRAQNASNTKLLSAVSETENPLPATIIIQPDDPNRMASIKTFLDKKENAALQSDATSYSGDLKTAIDNIAKATHYFREAGVVGTAIFTVISVLIILNTIRMAIFNRRDELIIMRLLGASPWYIRGPFVVETIIYGIIAALVSVAGCAALFAAQSALQASTFGLLDLGYASRYFSNHLWLILVGQVGAGIIIGALSSVLATRRYLKLK